MAQIELRNVKLEYPIYDLNVRSFRKLVTGMIPVGGRLEQVRQQPPAIVALDGVSLRLEDGDRVALLGHNGAGKTSLLKLLAGFYEPTSGSIEVEGRVAALLNLMSGMDSNLSGYENIELCGKLYGLSKQQIAERLPDIAQFCELGSYLEMPVRLYSSGMLLRLTFSICTSIDSEILLLDEWVGAGDERFIKKAQERLSDFVSRSAILVFATHNTEVAKRFCNKAIFLQHGELQAQGNIEDVIETYQRVMHQSPPRAAT